MKKERILSTAVFLVSISAGAMANNAIPNQEGAAIAKQLTEKAGASAANNLQQNRNEVKVTGTVFDSLKEPIIGATVRVKGGQAATVTDIEVTSPSQPTLEQRSLSATWDTKPWKWQYLQMVT